MRSMKAAMFLLACLCFLSTYAIYQAGFVHWPPGAHNPDHSFSRHDAVETQLCVKARMLAAFGEKNSTYYWRVCEGELNKYRTLRGFNTRYFSLIGSGAVGVLALFGFAFAVRLERPNGKVIRGRRYLKDAAANTALRHASKSEWKQSGRGLEFPPRNFISLDRETRHWLIWGSVGGGKTQSMLHLMLGAMVRGDKVLILDTKGDMTATLPYDPVLVAPQDERSFCWDVATDCRTKQDARELAARFIPPSSDPMWSDAAREVFVACVVFLQATKKTDWTWRDLHEVVISNAKTLFGIAKAHHPEAMRVLEDPSSKTTQSVLATFQAHMNVVGALADAWADDDSGKFSVSQWLQMEPPVQPIILQRDAKYPELSNAWIGGLLGLLASSVGSPSLSESRSRRVWLFIDEFPQLPRLKHFSTFLDVGRSKGVIVVLGAQDVSQIRAVYGREQTNAWISMIGTQIITRLNSGPGAEEASAMIGDQEIERRTKSVSTSGGRSTVTEGAHREIRRVVSANEISDRLRPTRKGIRALMLGPGEDVYEITLPYVELPQHRKPAMPAEWTYKSTPPRISPLSVKASAPRSLLSKDAADRIQKPVV